MNVRKYKNTVFLAIRELLSVDAFKSTPSSKPSYLLRLYSSV